MLFQHTRLVIEKQTNKANNSEEEEKDADDLNFTLPHVFLEDSWRIPTIPGGIPYSDVIYHSDRFFKLSSKITLS